MVRPRLPRPLLFSCMRCGMHPRARQHPACNTRAACCPAVPAGEAERLRALRMLGVVQQPVGQEFGSITRYGGTCLRPIPPPGACRRPSPRSLVPALPSPRLLKLIFDVPLAQAFLMEAHASYGVPNSPDEPWGIYPRWWVGLWRPGSSGAAGRAAGRAAGTGNPWGRAHCKPAPACPSARPAPGAARVCAASFWSLPNTRC